MTALKHAPGLQRNRSLARAAALLHAIAAQPAGASTSRLADATGLPYATAARMLVTLADAALVDRLRDGERWILGRELVRLARQADPHRSLIRSTRPALERIADATGESAMLGVWNGPLELDVVDQVDSPQPVGVTRWVGRPFELHASAMGKLALAALDKEALDAYLATHTLRRCTARTITDASALRKELQRVRRLDYAATLDELDDGVTGLAVPLRTRKGELFASLILSAPSFRMPVRAQRHGLRVLREECSALGEIAA